MNQYADFDPGHTRAYNFSITPVVIFSRNIDIDAANTKLIDHKLLVFTTPHNAQNYVHGSLARTYCDIFILNIGIKFSKSSKPRFSFCSC